MVSLAKKETTCLIRSPTRSFSEPGNVAKPRTILYDMLSMTRSVSQPGLVIELPYRWRRETYPPIIDWTADSAAAVSVPPDEKLIRKPCEILRGKPNAFSFRISF
jgi:hypothetical protein